MTSQTPKQSTSAIIAVKRASNQRQSGILQVFDCYVRHRVTGFASAADKSPWSQELVSRICGVNAEHSHVRHLTQRSTDFVNRTPAMRLTAARKPMRYDGN